MREGAEMREAGRWRGGEAAAPICLFGVRGWKHGNIFSYLGSRSVRTRYSMRPPFVRLCGRPVELTQLLRHITRCRNASTG